MTTDLQDATRAVYDRQAEVYDADRSRAFFEAQRNYGLAAAAGRSSPSSGELETSRSTMEPAPSW